MSRGRRRTAKEVDIFDTRANDATVRVLIAIAVACIGALAGLASAWHDSLSTRFGMAALGLLVAVPISAAVLSLGRHRTPLSRIGTTPLLRDPLSADAIAVNFDRDRGHPPNMKPPDALPDKHQFDLDKLG